MTEVETKNHKELFTEELFRDWNAFLDQRRSKYIKSGREMCNVERTRWTSKQLVCNHQGHLYLVRDEVPDSKKGRRFHVEELQGPSDLSNAKFPSARSLKALRVVSVHSPAFLYSEKTGYLQRSYAEDEKLLDDPEHKETNATELGAEPEEKAQQKRKRTRRSRKLSE